MPGSSLWLVPPPDSELYREIHSLIREKIPSIYPDANPTGFIPHVTLSAETKPNTSHPAHPQEWLDSIALPETVNDLKMVIRRADVEAVFFRALILKCDETAELKDLAAHARAAMVEEESVEDARAWIEEHFLPHCSLMYSNLPDDKVRDKLDLINQTIRKTLENDPSCRLAKGGSIVLVPTYKDIHEWIPIASRELKSLAWTWTIRLH